jgi:PAS domain S-box-containing protein
LCRGDGGYGWVLCSGVPRFLAGGVFAGFIGSCIEITDQMLIEEGLRASEMRLMAAQHLAHVGSWERHVDGSAIHWSAELLRILGIANAAPADLAGFLTHVHPKDRGKVLDLDGRIRAKPEPIEAEYRVVRPDGEVRFVRAVLDAIRDNRGTPVRITEAIQDITEQVRAREQLRESEQHLRNAERLAHVGHFQWDVRTNVVTGSEEMYRIFGKPPDFVPTYEIFLEDLTAADRERMGRLIQDSLERRTGNRMEYQITHPGGDVRTIACIWEVLVDEEGAPARLFGTCQDITESRRAQEESFGRQKLETLGTLASGIAHDFNNLLGGVLAQADLALTECGAGADPRPELNAIRNVAVRGSEIVRQLMIYAGQKNAAAEPVDVSQIVREMLELLKFSVSKRATLETHLEEDLPPIGANPAQLRQVVMNLVMNASDAIGDRDGVIRVTTRLAKAAAESAGNGASETDRLLLEVCDTGRGMASETQAKVFDPFFTTKAAGHGLGLAVVHGIVRSLGGTVVVRSEPEKGATFQVLLPVVKTAAGGREAASLIEPAPAGTSGAAVLFVEDETFLREAIARMLRKSGYEVWEAADGAAAIDLLRENDRRIDLILLDATIPGASAQEIVAEAAKLRPEIPVVLTSAYGRDRIAGALAAPQVREFIRKPFPFEELVKTLRKTLSA